MSRASPPPRGTPPTTHPTPTGTTTPAGAREPQPPPRGATRAPGPRPHRGSPTSPRPRPGGRHGRTPAHRRTHPVKHDRGRVGKWRRTRPSAAAPPRCRRRPRPAADGVDGVDGGFGELLRRAVGVPLVWGRADVRERGRWACQRQRDCGQFRVDHHTTSPAINGDRIQAATSIHPSTMPAVARARPRRNPRDRSIRALAREPNTSARTVARAEAVMAGTTKPNSPLPAGTATINAEHAATSDAAAPRSILPAPSPPALRATLARIAQLR
jgi:hypothetical protein